MMLEIAIGETEITLNQLLSQVEQGETILLNIPTDELVISD